MQRVDEMTEPPIVGQTYLVPCVYGTTDKRDDPERYCWLPIIGPPHSDKEYIGFEPVHFHYDHRFLSPRERGSFYLSHPLFYVMSNWDRTIGIKHQELRCLREVHGYPHASFHDDLSDAYAAKRVTCGKCPHRGLPLGSLPRIPGTNIVTCPGHGLQWDLETGSLVRKPATK